jgi:hypothetical protein
MFNYCLVKPNKIHENLHDILTDEELFMHNMEHKYNIKKIMDNLIVKNVELSKTFDISKTNYNELAVAISKDYNYEHITLNTLYIDMNKDYNYELVYIEEKLEDMELNQFGTIINAELEPIYGMCAIVKSDKNKKGMLITLDDIKNIYFNIYYHIGLMVNPTNVSEITFTSEIIQRCIGNSYKQLEDLEILGLNLVLYQDKQDNILNEKITKLYNKNMYGSFFITSVMPISLKKHINFNNDLLDLLIQIKSNPIRYEEIIKNITIDVCENPFLHY